MARVPSIFEIPSVWVFSEESGVRETDLNPVSTVKWLKRFLWTLRRNSNATYRAFN